MIRFLCPKIRYVLLVKPTTTASRFKTKSKLFFGGFGGQTAKCKYLKIVSGALGSNGPNGIHTMGSTILAWCMKTRLEHEAFRSLA